MSVVRLTTHAEDDLLDAWMHIAQDNPDAADALIDSLLAAAYALAEHPSQGRARPELQAGLRSWVTQTPYLIFYMSQPHGITVIRFLHHARDESSILGR
jgi:toxin ParE1/3/4